MNTIIAISQKCGHEDAKARSKTRRRHCAHGVCGRRFPAWADKEFSAILLHFFTSCFVSSRLRAGICFQPIAGA
jgi:hypothetical protein